MEVYVHTVWDFKSRGIWVDELSFFFFVCVFYYLSFLCCLLNVSQQLKNEISGACCVTANFIYFHEMENSSLDILFNNFFGKKVALTSLMWFSGLSLACQLIRLGARGAMKTHNHT